MKKALAILVGLVFLASAVWAQEEKVISLGNDLNEEQRQEIIRLFNADGQKTKIITVTNSEERQYLMGVVPEERIGTRAISSAIVERRPQGEGIVVETYNINWVTKEMYANALVTAGVRDARVKVAAPVPVSGTAGLTGVMKAFEQLEGKTITEDAKQIANEEMVKTGELGEEIGDKAKASQLVKEVKERVIERNVRDIEEIRRIIIDISARLDININQRQVDELAEVVQKITRLNLNVEVIKNQVNQLSDAVRDVSEDVQEARGFFARLIEALRRIVERIVGIFNKNTN